MDDCIDTLSASIPLTSDHSSQSSHPSDLILLFLKLVLTDDEESHDDDDDLDDNDGDEENH